MGYEGYEKLRVTVEDGVATVTIDNPPINLFDLALYLEMQRLAPQLRDDPDARVVVLRSATPGFFIAHFDVGLILRIPTDLPEPTELNDFHAMCETFRTMPKATIAVVEGRAGGGGSELALSCDMRFAARDTAIFNQPEVALGIIPGGSGTQRLARLVGRSRALEIILSCDDVDAELAEQWGWVNRALSADELWPFVDRLAARMATFPSHAVAEAKASVLRAEKEVGADLLAEGAAFNRTLGRPGTRARMERFLASGGQTVAGEQRVGELVGDLAADS
ncbi:MAG TPA: enoyl-CoA hydratase/isomerase family protein [Acidimicrobiales bacterium]|nr:enoyl-CoA hydratase/isomerase family protein [Acidimicrobiales bacterium]